MLRKRVPGVVVSFLTSTTRTRPDTSAPATTSPTKSGPVVYYLVCARRRSRPRWDRRLSGPVCVCGVVSGAQLNMRAVFLHVLGDALGPGGIGG